MLVVMLLIAINYQNNLVYGLVFLFGTILVVTVHLTFANLYGLSVSGLANTPVFLGQEGQIRLHLAAPQRRRMSIRLSAGSAQTSDNIDNHHRDIDTLIAVIPTKRGRFDVGRIRIETDYPFGLIRCWSWVDVAQPLWVYPHPKNPPDNPTVKPYEGTGTALQNATDGADWISFRSYGDGDPIRQIHWGSVARGSDPQIRVMGRATSDETSVFDFDAYADVDIESRLSWLCFAILRAHSANLGFTLKLPSTTLGPASGSDHRDRALMALARFDHNPDIEDYADA